MAITKIWNIPKSRRGSLSASLRRSLIYIVNPEKTEGGLLVGSVNCFPDATLAYEQMCETKQMFGKELGRQGYHIVLSCPIGEGDPQTMYQLTEEFIHEFLGDRYEVLFVVHVDKGHLHSHIIYNSCNMIDGYKYQYQKGDWKNIIQPITNKLCEKYGWSIMPAEYSREPQKMSRREYEYQKSMKEVILADAEYCMAQAETVDELIWNLEQLGYEVKKGKHIAVRMGGMSRFRRLDTLDESYAPEMIEQTLAAVSGTDKTVKVLINDAHEKMSHWKSDYQKSFYVKMVQLRRLETHRFTNKAARYYKDIQKMKVLQEQYLYLVKHDMTTPESVLANREEVAEDIAFVSKRQKETYADNRRLRARMEREPESAAEVLKAYDENREFLSFLKQEKKKYNEELKLIDSIITEALYQSVIHLEFEDKNIEKTDVARPKVPESPWKRARRERAEQEEKKRLEKEAERQRVRRMEEQAKWEKRQAYNKWFNDCNSQFMAVVELPTDTLYVQDYLNLIQEKMQIKPEEESIEFFQTPVITFSEYEAQKIREEMQNNQEMILQKEEQVEKVKRREDFAEEETEDFSEKPKKEQKEAETWNTSEKSLTESVEDVEDEVYQSQLLSQKSRQEAFDRKVLEMLRLFDVVGYSKESMLDLPDYLMTPLLVAPKMGKEEFAEIYVEAVRRMGVNLSEQELYEKADRIYDGEQIMQEQMLEEDTVQGQAVQEQVMEEQNESDIAGAKPEEKESLEFPDSYEEFIRLPLREQAKFLCPDYSDLEYVFDHLKSYAESVHHRFDYFSEAYDTAMSIQQEAEKMYLEEEAALRVDELKRAGATKENFRDIKADAMAPAFEYLSDDEERFKLYPLSRTF